VGWLSILIVNGPPVIAHDQSTGVSSMSVITSRSTKTEILQAYQELQATPTTWADAWALISGTAQTVSRETVLLARDVVAAGRTARRWADHLIDIYSQPVLRSK
jgi:pyrimidine operon attenuation protein/uracil phosphoribosyltransferase